jgi:hypothetical protein
MEKCKHSLKAGCDSSKDAFICIIGEAEGKTIKMWQKNTWRPCMHIWIIKEKWKKKTFEEMTKMFLMSEEIH